MCKIQIRLWKKNVLNFVVVRCYSYLFCVRLSHFLLFCTKGAEDVVDQKVHTRWTSLQTHFNICSLSTFQVETYECA